MTGLLTVILLGVSLYGLIRLQARDAKRARVLGERLAESKGRNWFAHLAIWLPGVVFLALGQWAGLVMWFGALTFVGWVFAALTPSQVKGLGHVLRSGKHAVLGSLVGAWQRVIGALTIPSRLAKLEARCEKLESLLAEREQGLAAHPVDRAGVKSDPVPQMKSAG